jgi:hypothetical protein
MKSKHVAMIIVAVCAMIAALGWAGAWNANHSDTQKTRQESACVSSGGNWVTNSKIGDPTNHDCRR